MIVNLNLFNMKSFTRVLYAMFSSCIFLTSCYKGVLEEVTTVREEKINTKVARDSSEVGKLLAAQTWQIEEVVDPFSGVRYKRGSVSDGKEFYLARYTYRENGSITGTDWFGKPIINTLYSLQDGDQKLIISAPDCTSINEILFISATKFTYKANDGSVFTLTPVQQPDAAL